MNRRRATPILVTTLALVVMVLLASAATVARAQVSGGPTTPLLDDFERPNENPLSGGGNWAKLIPAVSNELQLLGNGVETAPPGNGYPGRYWTPRTFGPDAEVYVRTARLGGWHQDVRLYLRAQNAGTNSLSGYELIGPWNGITGYRWLIRRFDNGVFTTLRDVGSLVRTPVGILFRAHGSTLEGWATNNGTTWSLVLSANDSTYAGAGYLAIGIGLGGDSGGPRLEEMGGGTIVGPPPPGQSNGTFCDRGSIALTASCTLSDPVNTLTGSFVHQEEDLATPGTGVPFAWTRTYTSGDATVGPLGPGWTHSYAASLAVQGNGDVLARSEEGQEVYFTKQGDGSFLGAAGARATLSARACAFFCVSVDG